MSQTCPVCLNEVPDNSTTCQKCGFALVGTTQAFDVLADEDYVSQKSTDGASHQLRIVRGPQVDTIFKLDADSLTIGRDPHCDIFLNDMTVSRMHAKLAHEQAGYRIIDDNSFNGVWLNSKLVDNAALRPGDQVQIGVFRLVYEEA